MLTILFLFLLLIYLFFILTRGKTKSPRCLVGKVAIVTGGNKGIGYQVCLNLASRGCRVIIADKDDSNESRRKIIELTGNPNVGSKILDLSSFKSVRQFVSEIIKTEPKLDILINNAGIGASSEELTEDGLSPVMQVNHFGPFLLTHLLTDLLKKSAPSRIVFTSSFLVFLGHLTTSNIKIPRRQSNLLANLQTYCNSKIAVILTSDIFAEKLKGTGVTCNSVNPGWVNTTLLKQFKSFEQIGGWVIYLAQIIGVFLGKDVWYGSQTTTHLAVSDEAKDVTGKYFWDCRQFPKQWQCWNKEFGREIWKISEECVQLSEGERL